MNRATARRIRGVALPVVLLLAVCGTLSSGLVEGAGARVVPAEGTPGAEVYLPLIGRGYPVEMAPVAYTGDEDTIDVQIGGETYRLRSIGIDSPERVEVCLVRRLDRTASLS